MQACVVAARGGSQARAIVVEGLAQGRLEHLHLSNRGVCRNKTVYSSTDKTVQVNVTDLKNFTALTNVGAALSLNAMTYDGSLQLTFGFVDPLVSESEGEQFASLFLKYLEDLIFDA